MKRIKYLFIFVLFFFVSVISVSASNFQPRVSLYEDYDGQGTVYIGLWYEGETLSHVTNTFKYDASLFSIDNIDSYDFDVEVTKEEKDGKYKILYLEADAAENHEEYNYAIIALKLKSGFKVGDTSYLTFADYIAEDIDGNKYKNDGLITTIKFYSTNEIDLISEVNTDYERTQVWIDDRIYLFIFIIIIVVVLLIVFLVTPHNFLVSNRKKSIKKSIKNNKNNPNVKGLNLDVDDISSIGEKPKEEPKNKLELGGYDPFSKNKSKEKHDVTKDKDFKETNVDAFNKK